MNSPLHAPFTIQVLVSQVSTLKLILLSLNVILLYHLQDHGKL